MERGAFPAVKHLLFSFMCGCVTSDEEEKVLHIFLLHFSLLHCVHILEILLNKQWLTAIIYRQGLVKLCQNLFTDISTKN